MRHYVHHLGSLNSTSTVRQGSNGPRKNNRLTRGLPTINRTSTPGNHARFLNLNCNITRQNFKRGRNRFLATMTTNSIEITSVIFSSLNSHLRGSVPNLIPVLIIRNFRVVRVRRRSHDKMTITLNANSFYVREFF